jgi:hypothetical protein
MAILRLSTTARNALANPLKTAIGAGSGAGTIKIYDGTQPSTPQDVPSGSNHLLATLTFGDPSFGLASTGVITAETITGDTLAGTAAWARIADSDGNAIMDVDLGITPSTNLVEEVNRLLGYPALSL